MSVRAKSFAILGAVIGVVLALYLASQMPASFTQPASEYYIPLTLIVITTGTIYAAIGLVVARFISAKQKHGVWGAAVFVIALVCLAANARGSVLIPPNWSSQLLSIWFYPLAKLLIAVLPKSTPQGMAGVLDEILVFTTLPLYAAATGYLAGHACRLLFAYPRSLEYR